MKLSEIKSNPNNPRVIRDESFKSLMKSLQDFPKMMEVRPIVINQNGMIMGGNQRYRALLELGYKEVPDSWVKKYEHFTAEEWQEFVIKDNVGFGQWNWEQLASEDWDNLKLKDWGLQVMETPKDVDYSILAEDIDNNKLDQMASNVKKSLVIEFELEHYEEAAELYKFWREQKMYVGYFLLEKLREEKEKLSK